MGATPGRPHHTGRPWLRLRMQILERDQWTCQLPQCHYPTRDIPRSGLRRMHPMSASVDLIVPKSHGGSDTDPANLRAAHLSCNSRRGNGTREPRIRYGIAPPRVG